MRYIYRILSLMGLAMLHSGQLKLQAQETWKEVKLHSFQDLYNREYILLHPNFFVAGADAKSPVRDEEIHTAFHISKEQKGTFMFTFLAAGNPMKWAFRVLDDTHAEWYDLSCDCNVGLESSIFSNNRNPYSKLIATLTLNKEGGIDVHYSGHFRKDFLARSAFSNEFFLDTYRVYQLQK